MKELLSRTAELCPSIRGGGLAAKSTGSVLWVAGGVQDIRERLAALHALPWETRSLWYILNFSSPEPCRVLVPLTGWPSWAAAVEALDVARDPLARCLAIGVPVDAYPNRSAGMNGPLVMAVSEVDYLLMGVALTVFEGDDDDRGPRVGATGGANPGFAPKSPIERTAIDMIGLALGEREDLAEAGKGEKKLGKRARRLHKILREIRDGYRDPRLSAKAVACRAGITTRYLHVLLRSSGASFSERVTTLRLDKAWTDLNTPDSFTRAIADVGFAAGFGDPWRFNQAFRKRFGQTPGEARNAFLERIADSSSVPAKLAS